MTDQNKTASGILAIWHDVVPEHDQAANEWYNREHHEERLAITGFLSARRHRALIGAPRYFSMYETTDPSVLASGAYIDKLNNPSEWTREMMSHYRNTSRAVCHRDISLGAGHGAFVMTIRYNETADEKAALGGRTEARVTDAVGEPGIVSVQVWTLDDASTDIPTEEKEIRGALQQAEVANKTIVVTGTSQQQVDAARQRYFSSVDLVQRGIAGEEPDVGLYQLIYSITQ
jgi:hypothetical protein